MKKMFMFFLLSACAYLLHAQEFILFNAPPRQLVKPIHPSFVDGIKDASYSVGGDPFGVGNEHFWAQDKHDLLKMRYYTIPIVSESDATFDYDPDVYFDSSHDTPLMACIVHRTDANFKTSYYILQSNGLCIEIPNVFTISQFRNGLAVVHTLDNQYNVIDYHGKVVATGYSEVGWLSDNRRAVCKCEQFGEFKWGYVDDTFHEITPCIYKDASTYSCRHAWVKKANDAIVVLDLFGQENSIRNELIGPVERAYDFLSNKAIVVVSTIINGSVVSQYQKVVSTTGELLYISKIVDSPVGDVWNLPFPGEDGEVYTWKEQKLFEEEEKILWPISDKQHIARVDGKRQDAFSWHNIWGRDISKGPTAPTALPCDYSIKNRDGQYEGFDIGQAPMYKNDGIIYYFDRMEDDDNPSNDYPDLYFKGEYDGITIYEFDGNTYVSYLGTHVKLTIDQ